MRGFSAKRIFLEMSGAGALEQAASNEANARAGASLDARWWFRFFISVPISLLNNNAVWHVGSNKPGAGVQMKIPYNAMRLSVFKACKAAQNPSQGVLGSLKKVYLKFSGN